jgi:hypothetical protein
VRSAGRGGRRHALSRLRLRTSWYLIRFSVVPSESKTLMNCLEEPLQSRGVADD